MIFKKINYHLLIILLCATSALQAAVRYVMPTTLGGSTTPWKYISSSLKNLIMALFSPHTAWLPSRAVVLAILLFYVGYATPSLAQNYAWAKSMGSANMPEASDDEGLAITADASGNVYTTGFFWETVDFDPGPGTTNLTSAGTWRATFISKLDASGNLIWAKSMGGAGDCRGHAIAVDASGNVYTTGQFFGTTDFDPGAGTANLTPAGGNDIFISKLDASGNFVWAKSMGATFGTDCGNGIAVDASGNVYTTGFFWGTVDFDPGPGTTNLTSGGDDIFISKLDASGNFVWAKSMGSPIWSDYGYGIAVDASGNVYTTGSFGGTADFDPGPGTANLTLVGSANIFISKLDASGNFVWAKSMGGTATTAGRAIALDPSNNVYTTGSFTGTTDFDPNAGTANLTFVGVEDIFISKLDASGNYLWAKSMGANAADAGYGIATDASGNVYTTGVFTSTVDFDPGAGTVNLTALMWSRNVFISKLDASGNFVWAKSIESDMWDDYGYGIDVDASGNNVYITGVLAGTADFDPGVGTANLTSTGQQDIFVLKLGGANPPTITTGTSPAICAGATSFTIPYTATTGSPTTYSISGTGITSVTDAALPSSPITVNLSSPASGSSITYTLTVKDAGGTISNNVLGSVTVNPAPTVAPVGDQAHCAGSPTTAVAFSGTGATSYTWTNNNTAIGLAASGTGNIAAFTATNNTGSPITATITVTPTNGPSASFAYIANYLSDNVSVINTVDNTVVATVPVGDGPYSVSVSPDGSRVYVANYFSDNVSVINTATNTVITTVAVGDGPYGVSVSPDGSRVYVTNYISDNVSVINTATNTVVATVAAGDAPSGVSVSPDGSRVYVTNLIAGTVSVINTADNTVVATVTVGTAPWVVSVSPDGSRVYVTNYDSDNVSVINTATNTVITTVAVGNGPYGVSVSPDGSRVYVTNYLSDNVSVINTATNTVITTVAVGDGPSGVSVSPDGSRVYVTNYLSDNVSVINTVDNTVITTVAVGDAPYSLGNFITPGAAGCTGSPTTFTITVNACNVGCAASSSMKWVH